MANISLKAIVSWLSNEQGHIWAAYVYLPMLKSLLQILVDGFVRDFAQQSQIRNSDFFLLRDLKVAFLICGCPSSPPLDFPPAKREALGTLEDLPSRRFVCPCS